MKVLFLGDIIGKPGRNALTRNLDSLIRENEADMVIANGENAAGGIGISPEVCSSLLKMGIDIVTSGNHIFKKKEIIDYLGLESRLLKPANYPPGTPGKGYYIYEIEKLGGLKVAVINICGRVFVDYLDCPFRTIEKIIEYVKEETPVIIVDIHAEVTSEKVAMGWFLDGQVSAVIGTHTHVQTADERVLPGGTAYITDAGMVGPRNSVIGVKKENIIKRFLTQMPQQFTVSKEDVWINGVALDIDEKTGKAREIIKINREADAGD